MLFSRAKKENDRRYFVGRAKANRLLADVGRVKSDEKSGGKFSECAFGRETKYRWGNDISSGRRPIPEAGADARLYCMDSGGTFLLEIPSFFIFEFRVVGFSPRISAAPFLPRMRQPDLSSTEVM